MPFFLIKISLIIFAASHIAIAGPVPDVLGSAIAVKARAEQVSGGSVYSSSQGDSARGLDLLELLSGTWLVILLEMWSLKDDHSGNGDEEVHPEKPASHSKGEGRPSAVGTHHGPENPVGQSASPFGASAQGGPDSGGVLNVLSSTFWSIRTFFSCDD